MLQTINTQLKVRLSLGLLTIGILLTDMIDNLYMQIALCVPVYLFVSYPVLIAAFKDLFMRRRMSEKFLMSVATFGAYGLGDFAEALAVMVFYLIGEAFEEYAAARSHNEISSLIKLKPSKVRVINEDGSEEILRPRKCLNWFTYSCASW